MKGKDMAKKIMIIDDERDFQEIYALMLEGRDYNLINAYDGDEAMQMLEDNKPDLIILDMMMDMVTGDTFFLGPRMTSAPSSPLGASLSSC